MKMLSSFSDFVSMVGGIFDGKFNKLVVGVVGVAFIFFGVYRMVRYFFK